MKFIHLSDTHLGCEVPVEYREIRRKDFLQAFQQVISFAIENRVDFIIHSGDLFDDYFKISSDLAIEIVRELSKLQDARISFIVIKGNHDVRGHRQKFFDLLRELGMIKVPSIKSPVVVGDVAIYGISEPSNISGEDLREVYKKILPTVRPEKDKYNIFLFHGISDIFGYDFPDPRIIPGNYLPKGFDYYGFGHFHISNLYKEGDTIYALPGSTERTEISDRERDSKKGFYFISDSEIQFIELKTRPISIIRGEIKSEDDLSSLVRNITSLTPGSLVKVKLSFKKEMHYALKSKLDALRRLGYLIIEDLYPEEIGIVEDFTSNINTSELFDAIISRLYPHEKEELKKVLNIALEALDEVYSEKNTDVDKIKDYLRARLFEDSKRWYSM